MRDVLAAFDAVPSGRFEARYRGRRWIAVKSAFADGKSENLVAEELGGPGYVSLNLYRLSNGRALLKPCEMPEAVVVDFILGAETGTP